MKKLFLPLLLFLLPGLAWGGNYGSSIEGKDANVTFVHTSAIDSAHVVFGYPDTTNWYDSVFTYPVAWGSSKIMNGAGLDLDSIGVHVVKVRYYSGGAVTGHTAGVWLHQTGSGAGGADTSDIGTLIENRWDSDTDGELSVEVGGEGTYACTVEVRDSSLQAGIQGVKVIIRNHASTATVRWSTTDADGKAFFGIDTLQTGHSFKLWLQQLGYNFTFPEALDLRNDTTAVYYGTAFDIGDPPADSTCAVFDQIFDPQLDSLSGVKVCFWLEAPADSLIVYDGVIFSPYEVCTTTTANGRWRLDLLPESLFHRPSGMVYWKAKISYPFSHGGIIVEYDSVSVPVATQVNADEILH